MANVEQTLVKYTQGDWDDFLDQPEVTDWAGNYLEQINLVDGVEHLLSCHFPSVVLTSWYDLRVIIRSGKSPTSRIWGFQDIANQGNSPSDEALNEGKVTWLIPTGWLEYPVSSVDKGNKRIAISGDYSGQFSVGETIAIMDSSANDGEYTIAGVTHDVYADLTWVEVDEAIASAIADGSLVIHATQSVQFDTDNNDVAEGMVFVTGRNGKDQFQVLLPPFPVTLHQSMAVDQPTLRGAIMPRNISYNEALALLNGAYDLDFDSGDLSTGILTVTHGLNSDVVHVAVFDDSDKQIIPDEVTITDDNTVTVSLASYTVGGTWRVIVIGKGGVRLAIDWQSTEWTSGTNYDAQVGLPYRGSSYVSRLAHLSAATSEPGVGASWETYWTRIAVGLYHAGAWALSAVYGLGYLSTNGGNTYYCKLEHTADAGSEPGVGGSWTTYWTLIA